MGANASHHEPLGPDGTRGPLKPHSTGGVFNPYGRASIRKSLKRRKEKRKQKENHKEDGRRDSGEKVEGPSEAHVRKMDKLRKSFRDSFRKKKEAYVPESSKPHLWQADESSVRAGTCSFQVKYMGCVEVFESRGMQVCEEALKVLRNSRRRPVRGILYVSGDGLRVVDDETKGLLVDQTIEKVSFCAPDRNHERGFSYICRDGTTRRWMCHGFVGVKETGERLSHAVGCAFAACLERKQKRDKECGVTMAFDQATSTFTRMGSFRQLSVTDRLSDPQECKPIEPVPVKKVDNPHAIARPHATPQLLQRQGSFRVFSHLNQSSPFKRQLSLRLCDLPSNIERTRSLSIDNSSCIENASNLLNNNSTDMIPSESLSPTAVPPHLQRERLLSLPNVMNMTPIPESESSPVLEHKTDAVSAMCQQVSAGLSLLSSFTDPFASPTSTAAETFPTTSPFTQMAMSSPTPSPTSADIFDATLETNSPTTSTTTTTSTTATTATAGLSKGEEWLAKINAQPLNLGANTHGDKSPDKEVVTPVAIFSKRAPPLSQLRSASLGSAPAASNAPDRVLNFSTSFSSQLTNGTSAVVAANNYSTSKPLNNDPFDAEWAALSSSSNPNNPFLVNTTVTKAFEVHM